MRSALIGALLVAGGFASPLAEKRFSPAPTGAITPPYNVNNITNLVGPTGSGTPGTPGNPGKPGWNYTTPMTTSTVFATNVYTVT